MTKNEFETWSHFMKASKGKWVLDPVHNGQQGREILLYVVSQNDHTTGVFIRIMDRHVEAGSFCNAVPHIGEALFTSHWSKTFSSKNEAVTRLFEKLGHSFLLNFVR